jgi:hypothetical protein
VSSAARRLAAALTVLTASALSAQLPGVPGPLPPLPSGYSVARLELARAARFGTSGRSWIPAFHGDVAVGNSRTRLGVSLGRYPGVDDSAQASLGGGLSLTRVLVDQESPARLRWLTVGIGTVGLDHEHLDAPRVNEVVIGAGAAKRFSPPAIGEVLVTLAPRLVWRRVSSTPAGMDRNAGGVGMTGALDWGSQARLGALIAVDVDWLSSRPASVSKLQVGYRLGASYRLLLFPRAHPMPPEE